MFPRANASKLAQNVRKGSASAPLLRPSSFAYAICG